MIKRKCPNCGEVVESKFCTSCGHDLTGSDIIKICPKCGTETASKFCTGCGTSLIDELVEKSDEKSAEKPNNDAPALAAAAAAAGKVISDGLKKEEGLSAANVFKKAKKIGAQKVQELEQSAETKKALREKEAELALEKQQREAELLREKQKKEAELALEQQRREAERREAEAARAAQEREENEKKQKQIKQKRVYAEAAAYIENASKIEDHGVAAQFYRKAEDLFSTIAGVEDADEKCLLAARKAKEHEIIIETERAKAEQAAKEEAERIKAEQAAKAEAERIKAEMAAKVEAERIKAEQAAKEESEAAKAVAASGAVAAEATIQNVVDDVLSAKEEEDKESGNTESQENKPAGKSKSKIFIVIAAVAVLAIIGLIFGLSGGGSDENDVSTDETVQIEDDAESYDTDNTDGAPEPPSDYTAEEKNCFESAYSYISLEDWGYSKQALTEQLTSESEQYPKEVVEKVINDMEKSGVVDWNEQCRRSAISYLSSEGTGYSKHSLKTQLTDEGEKYTEEQADKTIKQIEKDGSVDWDEQCRKCAKGYIDMGGYSKAALIEQLTSEFEGFSQEQAEKAVEAVYK